MTRRQWITLDVVATVVVVLVLSVLAVQPTPIGLVVLLLSALAVALRRVFPVPALAVAVVMSWDSAAGSMPKVQLLAVTCTLYTAIVAGASRRVLVLAGIGLVVGAGVDVAMLSHPVFGIGDPVPGPILVAAVPAELVTRLVEQLFVGGLGYVLGRSVAKQRAYAERLTEARMEEERLRIARDMHDIVTHTMSVVAVQAELGAYSAASLDEANLLLTSIARTSREALRDLRQVLKPDADFRPAPGLGDLAELVATTAKAIEVDLVVTGEEREVPAGVGVCAYRVVQEALTNVVKHADTNRCRVVVDYGVELTVSVTDGGRGGVPGEEGMGIAGMRERVDLCGGSLVAGPLPDGGFRVSVRLPL